MRSPQLLHQQPTPSAQFLAPLLCSHANVNTEVELHKNVIAHYASRGKESSLLQQAGARHVIRRIAWRAHLYSRIFRRITHRKQKKTHCTAAQGGICYYLRAIKTHTALDGGIFSRTPRSINNIFPLKKNNK